MPKFMMTNNLHSLPASPGRDRDYNGNIIGSTKVYNNPRSAIFGVNAPNRMIDQ
jgi:hypothetical protein